MVTFDLFGALGSVIGGWFGYQGQKSANKTNIQMGREQMDFQERMSNTAYQRAVADMQEAGLNPMLAYSQGGASAPMGSMPQVQNEAGAGVASAAQGANLVSAVQAIVKSQAETDRVKAETKQIESMTFDQGVNSAIRLQELEKYKLGNLYTEDDIRALRQELIRRQRENMLGKETFDSDVKSRKAKSALDQLAVPAAESDAEFWRRYESAPKETKWLLDIIRGLGSVIRR